jgi:hypothetical protein
MDVVASKMEDIAKSVIRILSDNVKNASGSSLSRDAPSILRLTLHSSKTSGASWNDPGRTDPLSSQALSIHLSGNDQQIRLRDKIGSAVFSLPAGSMLVTVGNQIQVPCFTTQFSPCMCLPTVLFQVLSYDTVFALNSGMVEWGVQEFCW